MAGLKKKEGRRDGGERNYFFVLPPSPFGGSRRSMKMLQYVNVGTASPPTENPEWEEGRREKIA